MPEAEPPILQMLLFESPGPLVALFGLVGLGLLVIGNRRLSRPMMLSGAAGVLIAIGLWALAWAVTTDREAIRRHTVAVVEAVETADLARIETLTGGGAELLGPGGQLWLSRTAFLPELKQALDRYNVAGNTIRRMVVLAEPPNRARSIVDLKSQVASQAYGEAPVQTRWQFHWTQTDGRWRLEQVQWMEHDSDAFNVVQPQEGRWR